jgi:elongation factor Tu
VGFWGKLFGRAEYDTTVTEYQATGPARPFRLDIEDVFTITGRGTVATGTIGSGILSVGDSVQVVHADGTRLTATVTGIEAFRKKLTSAPAGQLVGVLLSGVARDGLNRGDTLEA